MKFFKLGDYNRTSDANYVHEIRRNIFLWWPGFFYHWRACIEKAIKARHDFVRRPRDHLSRSSSREISRRPRALTLSRSINCWASNNRDRKPIEQRANEKLRDSLSKFLERNLAN